MRIAIVKGCRQFAAQRRAHALRLQFTRPFSSALTDGWERITRRNGDVVFYNAELRKTVRALPGVSASADEASSNESLAPTSAAAVGGGGKSDDSDTMQPPMQTHKQTQTLPHHEPTEDGVFVPIDFTKAMSIEGHDSQVVHIELEPQQCLRAETGAMIYMTDGVEMETTTAGGFQQGFKRMVTGENFFVTRFTYTGTSKGHIALGTSFPSKILRFKLGDFIGGSVICQKGAFLCGSDTVNIEMEFAKKFGVGFFGGEGFILQRLTGSGDALVRASGALIERDLQPGEVLRISSGCLVAFEPSVHYDIAMMKGMRNVLFGGEGLFVTTLTGPGKVYLQSMPFDRVVGEISRRVPGAGGPGMMFPMLGGTGGGAVDGGDTDSEVWGASETATSDNTASSDEPTWNTSDESIYGGADTDAASTETPEVADEDESLGESMSDFFSSFFGGKD